MKVKNTLQLEVTDELRKVFRGLMEIDYKHQVEVGNITNREKEGIIDFVNTIHSILEH